MLFNSTMGLLNLSDTIETIMPPIRIINIPIVYKNLFEISTLSSIEAQTNSISFAIPAELSLNIMNDIIKHGRVIRGYLGITAKDISADQAGYKNKSGIIVTSIDPAGPATNLLRTGDIITAINGIKVNNLKQVMNIIASSMPNTSLTFSLIRGDEILETSVLLAEQN